MRTSEISRKTGETDVYVKLNLDGKGVYTVSSGCGFLDHMLCLFSKHSGFDLEVKCRGDVYVDYHHSTEDIGIALGQAFKEALGDKKGIERYGDTCLPMDEALVLTAADISGRGVLRYNVAVPSQKLGDFDTELCEEFWAAFVREAGIGLHIRLLDGTNSHHIIEAVFKSAARTLRKAAAINEKYSEDIPSTKGVL